MFAKIAASAALRNARAFATRAAPAARASVMPLALGAGAAAFAAPLALEGPRTIAGEYKTAGERSFVMIKPDGTSRQIVGKIVDRFESRGYKLVAIKSVVPSEELAKQHYKDLSSKCVPANQAVLPRARQVHHFGHPRDRHGLGGQGRHPPGPPQCVHC